MSVPGSPLDTGTAMRLVAVVLVLVLGWVPARHEPRAAGARFVESAAASGLVFTHDNGATGQYYIAEQMGAGVALIDYDNDGDLDVFFVQGGPLSTDEQAPQELPTHRLFRNDLAVAGDGQRRLRFTDVTRDAGLASAAYGMGVAAGDYDNDGYVDLFVTAFGRAALYRNNGDGSFTDVAEQAGITDDRWSTSAAFVDYDRDGHLDLYVTHYVDFTLSGNRRCHDSVGARDYCAPRMYRPLHDRLYRNGGAGRFTDVTAQAGIGKAYGAGLGVVTGDFNGDGWLDLYVANDATPNQLWLNGGDGTFADEGVLSGAAFSAAGNPEGSMGIAAGDFDADGDEDLFVTNLVGETFVLYQNDGRGNFADVRTRVGLAAPTAAFTGFGTDWLDYDNDGWLDLFVTNGAVNVIEAQRGLPDPFRMRRQLFRNVEGTRFEETSDHAGPAFQDLEIGRGAAFGDVDNDGGVDIVVTHNGGAARLLLNQRTPGHHWLQLQLEQPRLNRRALGARIGVERVGRPVLWRRVRTDGSYLSASDPRVHIGLGADPGVTAVVVQWPDGQQQRWSGVASNGVLTLRRGTSSTP